MFVIDQVVLEEMGFIPQGFNSASYGLVDVDCISADYYTICRIFGLNLIVPFGLANLLDFESGFRIYVQDAFQDGF
jgi:hypothetical protein